MSIDFSKCIVPKERTIKVTPKLTTIAVDKPHKSSFFRTRYGEGWTPLDMFTYTPKSVGSEKQPYIVMPDQCGLLNEMELLSISRFFFYIEYGSNIMRLDMVSQKVNKQGEVSKWHKTHEEILEAGKSQWVRMKSNLDGGFYTYSVAEDVLPEPNWPNYPATLMEAIGIAFNGFVIDNDDHPILKTLRGKL